ncbi:MAG TPA: NAD(P)-dependent malic enzyme [Candidatus Brocadiia bacterium]
MPVPPKSHKKMSLSEEALELRSRYRGVLEVKSKIPVKDDYILNLLFLPPAAMSPVKEIEKDKTKVFDYTTKGNFVAIVTDGTAVLGLGNIGPRAGLPVMEGKAVLFHAFAGVEAFPICLATDDPDEIVNVVKHIAPAFGGINLEDISAPRCFYVEEQLKKELDIPVFHDDQHGAATVVLGGLINALKFVGKDFSNIKVAVNGAGAAGIAIAKLLLSTGVKDLTLCDTKGIIYEGREVNMNPAKDEIARVTNIQKLKGTLADAMCGCDVFIGVSAARVVTKEMVQTMAKDAIVFAMANPIPEIMPEDAKAGGARIVGTGRSDYDNQINNCLCFPGLFRGALDARARCINEEMKIAAAHAIASLVSDKELKPEYVIPSGMDFRVPPAVAAAVAKAAMDTGVARIQVDPELVAENTKGFIYEGLLV